MLAIVAAARARGRHFCHACYVRVCACAPISQGSVAAFAHSLLGVDEADSVFLPPANNRTQISTPKTLSFVCTLWSTKEETSRCSQGIEICLGFHVLMQGGRPRSCA